MPHPLGRRGRSSRLRARLATCVVLFAAAWCPGCGAGGSSSSTSVPDAGAGIHLVNAALTAKGEVNTHALVGLMMRSASGGPATTLPPFQLAPGDEVDIALPTGAWNLQATFDDGLHETVQSPGDAVHVYADGFVQVLFMH